MTEPRWRLRIDPAACDGIGVCAHLAPGLVHLDRWGFPVVVGDPLTKLEAAAAGRAVRGCPRQALWLNDVEAQPLRLNESHDSTA